MTDQVESLRIGFESDVKAGAEAAAKALGQLGAAAEETSERVRRTSKSGEQLARQYGESERLANQLAKATAKYARDLADLERSEMAVADKEMTRANILAAQEQALGRVRERHERWVSGMEAARAALSRMDTAEAGALKSTESLAAAYRKVMAEIDPMVASQQRYEKALAALRSGATAVGVSADQLAADMARVTAAMSPDVVNARAEANLRLARSHEAAAAAAQAQAQMEARIGIRRTGGGANADEYASFWKEALNAQMRATAEATIQSQRFMNNLLGVDRIVPATEAARADYAAFWKNVVADQQKATVAAAGESQRLMNSLLGVRELPALSSATRAEYKSLWGELTTSRDAAFARLMGNYDPAIAAENRYTDALRQVRQEAARVGATAAELAAAEAKVTAALDPATIALKEQAKAWEANLRAIDPSGHRLKEIDKAMAEVQARFQAGTLAGGREEFDRLTASADRQRAMLTRSAESADGLAGKIGLTKAQMQALTPQLNDVITGLIMGQPPMMIFTQQSGHIVQALQAGGATLPKFTAGLAVMVGGVVAAVAALGIAIWAADRYRSAVREMTRANEVMGQAQGLTTTTALAQADAIAVNAKVSQQTGREIVTAYVATGKIAAGVLTDLGSVTKLWARATGQEIEDATKDLAGIFSDPIKGVEALTSRYNLYDAAQVRLIKNYAAQHDYEKAQALMLAAVAERAEEAAQKVGVLGTAWDLFKRGLSAGAEIVAAPFVVPDLTEQRDSLEKLLEGLADRTEGDGYDESRAQISQKLAEVNQTINDQNIAANAAAWASDYKILSHAVAKYTAELFPATAAIDKFAERQAILDKAVAAKVVTQERANQMLARYRAEMNEAVSPMQAYTLQVERDVRVLRAGAGVAREFERARQDLLKRRGMTPDQSLPWSMESTLYDSALARAQAEGENQARVLRGTAGAHRELAAAQRSLDQRRIIDQTVELQVAQERANGATVTAETVTLRKSRAWEDYVTQVTVANARIHAAVPAIEGLTAAYGVSAAAVREAELQQKIANATIGQTPELAEQTAAALRRQESAQRDLAAAQADWQAQAAIDDQLRLAAATRDGAAAAQEAAAVNAALARIRTEKVDDDPARMRIIATQEYDKLLAGRQTQLNQMARSQAEQADIAYREFQLLGMQVDERARIVGEMEAARDLAAQGADLTDDQTQAYIRQAGELGKVRSIIEQNTQLAQDAASTIATSLEDAVFDGSKKGIDLLKAMWTDLEKIGFRTLITKPFETAVTGMLSRVMTGDVSGMVGQTAPKAASGASKFIDSVLNGVSESNPLPVRVVAGGMIGDVGAGGAVTDAGTVISRLVGAANTAAWAPEGNDIVRAIVKEADLQGVPREVALAVGKIESDFRQYLKDGSLLKSSAGAMGVMQLMPGTAADMGVDPTVTSQNIKGGIKYLAWLGQKFNGDWNAAAMAYNAGPGRMQKVQAGTATLPAETAAYGQKFTRLVGTMGASTQELVESTQSASTAMAAVEEDFDSYLTRIKTTYGKEIDAREDGAAAIAQASQLTGQIMVTGGQQAMGALMTIISAATGSTGGAMSGMAMQAGGMDNLMSGMSNLVMNKAGGWIGDKLGINAAWDKLSNVSLFSSGTGWAMSAPASVTGAMGPVAPITTAGSANAATGIATAGNTAAANTLYTGSSTGVSGGSFTMGGLSTAFSAGAIGGMLGSWAGTKTNSKAVGGLSGAAGGAIASMALAGSIIPGIGTAIGAIVGAIMGMIGTQKATSGPNQAAMLNVSNSGFAMGRHSQDNKGDLDAAKQMGEAGSAYLNTIMQAVGGRLNVAAEREISALHAFQKDGKILSVVNNVEKEFTSADEAMADMARRTIEALDSYGEISGLTEDVRTALKNSKAIDATKFAEHLAWAANFQTTIDTINNELSFENEARTAGVESAKALNAQFKEFAALTGQLLPERMGEAGAALVTYLNAMVEGTSAIPASEVEAAVTRVQAYWQGLIPTFESVGYSAAEAAERVHTGMINELERLATSGTVTGRQLGELVTAMDKVPGATEAAARVAEEMSDQITQLALAGELTVPDLRDLISELSDMPRVVEAAESAIASLVSKMSNTAMVGFYGATGQPVPVDMQIANSGLTQDFAIDLAKNALTSLGYSITTATADLALLDEQLAEGALTIAEYEAATGLLTQALQNAKAAAQVDQGLANRARAVMLGQITHEPDKVVAEYADKYKAEMDAARAAGHSASQISRLSAVLDGEFAQAMQAAQRAIENTVSGIRGSVNSALLGGRSMTADELFLTTGFAGDNPAAEMIRGLFAAVDDGLKPAEALRDIFRKLSDQYRTGAITADRYQAVMGGVVEKFQAGTQAMAQIQSSVKDFVSGFRTNIKEYLDAMEVSDISQYSPEEKLAMAQADFSSQLALARGGAGISLADQRAALNSITGYADRLLQAGLAVNDSGQDQMLLQKLVTSTLAGLPDQISEAEMIRREIEKLNEDEGERFSLLGATVDEAALTISNAVGLMRADLNGDLKITWAEFSLWAVANNAELGAIANALGLSNSSLRDIFAELDVNGDGVIDAVEAARGNIVAAVAANPSSIATALFSNFKMLDTSVNGLLDYTEFKAGLSGMATDAELKKIFTELDANGDGQLTKLELVRTSIIAAVNAQGPSVTAGGIASSLYPYFNMLNTTSDQGLSYTEFTAGLAGAKLATDANMTSWFRELDTNDDGQLSKLELMRAAEVATGAKIDTGNATLDQLKLTMIDNRTNTMNTITAITNAATMATNNAVAIIGAINALPHATGGPASGLTMINDQVGAISPEIIRLPGGSEVVTAQSSLQYGLAVARQMAGEGRPAVPPVSISAPVISLPQMARSGDPEATRIMRDMLDENRQLRAELTRLLRDLRKATEDGGDGVVDAIEDLARKTVRKSDPAGRVGQRFSVTRRVA